MGNAGRLWRLERTNTLGQLREHGVPVVAWAGAGSLDQVLREGQVEPDPAHAGPASSGGFMLPDRKPSRSTVT